MVSLTGCRFGFNTAASSSLNSGAGNPDELNVIVWESDLSETAVQDFEDAFGVKVNVTYLEDTNQLLQKMITGTANYDVLDLESSYVSSFVQADLLSPLDYSLIENMKNVDPAFHEAGQGAPGDEDFVYSLPLSGPFYTGVIVNKQTCPVEIETLKDLTNPKLKGQLCSVNSTISLYAGALYALGYSVNSTDDQELAEAQALLKKIKPNIQSFVGSSALSQLEAGDCSAAYCWDYDVLCADSEKYWDQFELIPGTALGYTQNWAIAKSSSNQALANEFINFLFRPEEYAHLIEEYGGTSILKKDLMADLLPSNYYDNPCVQVYTDLWADHVPLQVSDEQISKLDVLYNELMSQ